MNEAKIVATNIRAKIKVSPLPDGAQEFCPAVPMNLNGPELLALVAVPGRCSLRDKDIVIRVTSSLSFSLLAFGHLGKELEIRSGRNDPAFSTSCTGIPLLRRHASCATVAQLLPQEIALSTCSS